MAIIALVENFNERNIYLNPLSSLSATEQKGSYSKINSGNILVTVLVDKAEALRLNWERSLM